MQINTRAQRVLSYCLVYARTESQQNKSILRAALHVLTDPITCTSALRSFQALGPATANNRAPKIQKSDGQSNLALSGITVNMLVWRKGKSYGVRNGTIGWISLVVAKSPFKTYANSVSLTFI